MIVSLGDLPILKDQYLYSVLQRTTNPVFTGLSRSCWALLWTLTAGPGQAQVSLARLTIVLRRSYWRHSMVVRRRFNQPRMAASQQGAEECFHGFC
jgi:hypothetical protein